MLHRSLFIMLCFVAVTFRTDAQCFPDRHSTNFFDGWISCETAPNPNPARPDGHFILYDFGKTYKLGQMHIWNTNDPSHLEWGMQEIAIDVSLDGETWEHAGDYTIAQASGMSIYEGEEGPYLYDVEARYLLITGLSNYGGSCYGLSEVHITGEEVMVTAVEDIISLDCLAISIYPNPYTDKFKLSIEPGCTGILRYSLYNTLGHQIRSGRIEFQAGASQAVEIGKELSSGIYILYMEFGDKKIKRNVVKIERT